MNDNLLVHHSTTVFSILKYSGFFFGTLNPALSLSLNYSSRNLESLFLTNTFSSTINGWNVSLWLLWWVDHLGAVRNLLSNSILLIFSFSFYSSIDLWIFSLISSCTFNIVILAVLLNIFFFIIGWVCLLIPVEP